MCKKEGWISSENFIDDTGHQNCVINYPHLSSKEIFDAVEELYNKFYFRPKYIFRSIIRMLINSEDRKKMLKEGKQYLAYMKKRKQAKA
jgi:hypothetical protein